MRNAFAQEIDALAGTDPRVVLLSGDIGNRLFDPFKEAHGERFLNCGVAEANMTGVAAGMAMAGFRPFAYTIAAFATVRAMEQIRVDLCYHALPVTVVGVGAGLGYANLGYTHHAVEEVGMLRLLPGLSILCPADAWEVRGALHAALAHDGPVYLRIGKKGEPVIHDAAPEISIGGSLVLREGADAMILSVGTCGPAALEAADALAGQGIDAAVVSFYSVKPLDEALLARAFADYPLVAVVEEHSRLGGAGGAIAEWLATREGPRARFLPLGLPDEIFHEAGEPAYARRALGQDAASIAAQISAALAGTGA